MKLTVGQKISTPEGECTITNIWTDGVSADNEETFEEPKFFTYDEITPILTAEQKAQEEKEQYDAWVKQQQMDFLQNEGYFETANKTIECETFAQWLKLASARQPFRITEPWQKGDLGYGL